MTYGNATTCVCSTQWSFDVVVLSERLVSPRVISTQVRKRDFWYLFTLVPILTSCLREHRIPRFFASLKSK